MIALHTYTGVSIDGGCEVEGFYFCANNTDEHFILRGIYTIGMRKSQVNTEAILVDKRTVKLKIGENDE